MNEYDCHLYIFDYAQHESHIKLANFIKMSSPYFVLRLIIGYHKNKDDSKIHLKKVNVSISSIYRQFAHKNRNLLIKIKFLTRIKLFEF